MESGCVGCGGSVNGWAETALPYVHPSIHLNSPIDAVTVQVGTGTGSGKPLQSAASRFSLGTLRLRIHGLPKTVPVPNHEEPERGVALPASPQMTDLWLHERDRRGELKFNHHYDAVIDLKEHCCFLVRDHFFELRDVFQA